MFCLTDLHRNLAMSSLKNILTGLVLARLSLASPGSYPPTYHNGNDSGHDKLGAVASESSICSNIGTDILKEGGNAADSLIATTFCVGVIGMVRLDVYNRHGGYH